MQSPHQVIKSARKLIGTPYQHQGRQPGVGCDCLGLPILVGQELKLFDRLDEQQKSIIQNANYRTTPDGSMKGKIEFICLPTLLQPAALLVFRISAVEQHCGIVSKYMDGFGLIHAWDVRGVNSVCEHRLDRGWLNKVVGCYALPGVDYHDQLSSKK